VPMVLFIVVDCSELVAASPMLHAHSQIVLQWRSNLSAVLRTFSKRSPRIVTVHAEKCLAMFACVPSMITEKCISPLRIIPFSKNDLEIVSLMRVRSPGLRMFSDHSLKSGVLWVTVTRTEERRGVSEEQTHSVEMREFGRFIEDLEMFDLPLLGRQFTWFHTNGRTMSRIDRALVSPEWMEVQQLLDRTQRLFEGGGGVARCDRLDGSCFKGKAPGADCQSGKWTSLSSSNNSHSTEIE
ncbi:endonuclease/exonuclease/phosphatase family protein, partial [Trifolium medium]|nr:endonuclease/exonuclease/phosphatase family protein [Trifolium medium]